MKQWVLFLNDMRSAHYEDTSPAARGDSQEQLKALVERERVAPYTDGRFGKNFRQGGPLEWFNPPASWDFRQHLVEVDLGARYQQMVNDLCALPHAGASS